MSRYSTLSPLTEARPIPRELITEATRHWVREGGTPSRSLADTLNRNPDVALTVLPAVHVLALRQAANLFLRRGGADSPVVEALARLALEVEDSARTGSTRLAPSVAIEPWVEAFLTADPAHRATLASALTDDADLPPHEATLRLIQQRMQGFAARSPEDYHATTPIEALDMVIGEILIEAQQGHSA